MSERPPLPPDDARLASTWREHSAELPPAHLDAAILAAAHREAGSKPRAAGDDDALAEAREPSRWWWGLAAAATIGAIAFGVVQLAPPEPHTVPSAMSDVPPAASPKPAPSPQPFPRARESAPVQRMEEAPTERREAPPALGAQLQRSDAIARKAAPAAAAPASPAATPAAPAPPAPARAMSTAPIPSATEFIDRIRRAFDERRFEDAQRELAAFRAAYADADERLPEPVKSWAAGIPRSAQ